jgi:hypothetical protein
VDEFQPPGSKQFSPDTVFTITQKEMHCMTGRIIEWLIPKPGLGIFEQRQHSSFCFVHPHYVLQQSNECRVIFYRIRGRLRAVCDSVLFISCFGLSTTLIDVNLNKMQILSSSRSEAESRSVHRRCFLRTFEASQESGSEVILTGQSHFQDVAEIRFEIISLAALIQNNSN